MTLATPDLALLPGYNISAWAPTAESGSFGLTALAQLAPQCFDGGMQRQALGSGAN